jgi:hypothetical protein
MEIAEPDVRYDPVLVGAKCSVIHSPVYKADSAVQASVVLACRVSRGWVRILGG